jgi:antitoxin CcdA
MLQKFKHPSRRAVNVSIDRGLKEEARALGVNLSRAAEAGIAAAVKAEKTRVWKIENREAVETSTITCGRTAFHWPNSSNSDGAVRCIP